jgi:penicillin-binding protein 2
MGAELARRHGNATLANYARQMGFGRTTGLVYDPVIQEAPGQLAAVTSTDEAISAAIGQLDTQVSILQMARMVAGVANGGTLYTPYVVQQVGEGDNISFQGQPQVAGQMGLSQETLDIIREGMCAVTTDDAVGRSTGRPLGTAWFVFDSEDTGIAPYTVCGKTGTAQTGRIEPHGWFVAYAPADDPQIAVVVMVEHSREGSETAAPIVRRILDAYFGVTPAPFPSWWWEFEYVALQIPEGNTGG